MLKLILVTSPDLISAHLREAYPEAAVSWIEANRPSGLLFNDYNWGGYLVWNLREYPVFVDGRTDLFDDELLGAYLVAFRGEPGWERILDENQINLVLVPPGAGLVRELERRYGWREAFRDENAVIFLR